MGDNAPDRLFLLNLVLIRAGSDITALRQLYGELDLNVVSQKTAVGPSTTIARLTRLLVVRSSLYLTTLGPVRGKNRADAPKPHMRPFLFLCIRMTIVLRFGVSYPKKFLQPNLWTCLTLPEVEQSFFLSLTPSLAILNSAVICTIFGLGFRALPIFLLRFGVSILVPFVNAMSSYNIDCLLVV